MNNAMKKVRPAVAFMYAFLTLIALVSAFPFVWMALASTNKSVDIVRGRFFFGLNLLENWSALFSAYPMASSFLNSLRNAVVGTIVSLFVCSLAGYGFQVYRDKAKDRLMAVLLLSMMVPFASVMIPLFRMFSQAKLLNTTLGIILPSVSTAFLIFFFRQNSAGFPMEIVQAARVDGLSEFGIYLRIYVPVMAATFAAAAIIQFMGVWNNYLWPLIILLKKEAQTLPIMLVSITSGYTTDYGILMLAVTISTLPTVILFFTQQRRFVSGILGSVK
ncbi:MAG: carbohydrate ABC transporter permease [Clostridiales bacterium]|jgi:lactose/L-arabinose transport system permease protein|nr:carbohydrate ABC transporter permease [Clostridiales bacterium]